MCCAAIVSKIIKDQERTEDWTLSCRSGFRAEKIDIAWWCKIWEIIRNLAPNIKLRWKHFSMPCCSSQGKLRSCVRQLRCPGLREARHLMTICHIDIDSAVHSPYVSAVISLRPVQPLIRLLRIKQFSWQYTVSNWGKRSECVRCFERTDSRPSSRTSMTPHRVLETCLQMRSKFPVSGQSYHLRPRPFDFTRLCFGMTSFRLTPRQLAKVLHIVFICKKGASKIQCAFNALGLFCFAQSNEYQRFRKRFYSSLFQRLWIEVEFHFTGNGKKVGSILLVPCCHANRLNFAVVGRKIPQTHRTWFPTRSRQSNYYPPTPAHAKGRAFWNFVTTLPMWQFHVDLRFHGGGNFHIILSLRTLRVDLKFHGMGMLRSSDHFAIFCTLRPRLNLKFHGSGNLDILPLWTLRVIVIFMGGEILIYPDIIIPLWAPRINLKFHGGGIFVIISPLRQFQVALKFHGVGNSMKFSYHLVLVDTPRHGNGNLDIILPLWTFQVTFKFHKGGTCHIISTLWMLRVNWKLHGGWEFCCHFARVLIPGRFEVPLAHWVLDLFALNWRCRVAQSGDRSCTSGVAHPWELRNLSKAVAQAELHNAESYVIGVELRNPTKELRNHSCAIWTSFAIELYSPKTSVCKTAQTNNWQDIWSARGCCNKTQAMCFYCLPSMLTGEPLKF